MQCSLGNVMLADEEGRHQVNSLLVALAATWPPKRPSEITAAASRKRRRRTPAAGADQPCGRRSTHKKKTKRAKHSTTPHTPPAPTTTTAAATTARRPPGRTEDAMPRARSPSRRDEVEALPLDQVALLSLVASSEDYEGGATAAVDVPWSPSSLSASPCPRTPSFEVVPRLLPPGQASADVVYFEDYSYSHLEQGPPEQTWPCRSPPSSYPRLAYAPPTRSNLYPPYPHEQQSMMSMMRSPLPYDQPPPTCGPYYSNASHQVCSGGCSPYQYM